MRLLATLLLSLALAAPAFAANETSAVHAARRVSTPEDIKAINAVTIEFQNAMIAKDTKRLSKLMLNSNILFSSPPNAERVKRAREEYDVNFDGVRAGGYSSFAEFVGDPKSSARENFYNVNITQDGHLAWVLFDFDFIEGGKVVNHGVEAWQMLKTGDGQWKILSVVWTSKGTPK
jgi:ketosteroid isomerase-like protein